MTSIESVILEARDPAAAEAFYAAAFGLGDRLRVRASDAPSSGFRGLIEQAAERSCHDWDVAGPAQARYRGPVSSQRVPGGVAHELPADLRKALIANTTALAAWKDITPLARNEFICWVEDAKQEITRERRIRRTQEELAEGQRRPCCWPGCKHRERTGR